ncbi:hypothetical protein FSP39_010702 [Pinctada imbricata]|uniref:Uncharacterized protein n=1 Tax=Pinctada imbricata TaxID=66713 RepID=A0AA88YDW8_PINIB|nr:hypothetical protein FSP39_010702 [Pinctada imbricata]
MFVLSPLLCFLKPIFPFPAFGCVFCKRVSLDITFFLFKLSICDYCIVSKFIPFLILQFERQLTTSTSIMPVMWSCPGQPKCRKIYLYAQGLKAHIQSCRHAQSKRVRKRRAEMETILTIIQFVEDRQRGNITIHRRGVPDFRQPTVTLQRI